MLESDRKCPKCDGPMQKIMAGDGTWLYSCLSSACDYKVSGVRIIPGKRQKTPKEQADQRETLLSKLWNFFKPLEK